MLSINRFLCEGLGAFCWEKQKGVTFTCSREPLFHSMTHEIKFMFRLMLKELFYTVIQRKGIHLNYSLTYPDLYTL